MRAVLDACVLYPTVMRSLLLDAAEAETYAPLWSPRITEEWVRAAARSDGGANEGVIRAEAALVDVRFPDASQPVPDNAIEPILPDPNDDHVLGLARHIGAQAIVTLNERDFPTKTLARFDVLRVHPDALLLDALAADHGRIAGAVEAIRADIARMTGEDVPRRALLKRARLPRLAKALETAAS